MYEIKLTRKAKTQLAELKSDRGHEKRYKAVVKSIRLMADNPRHPGLQTHKYLSLHGPNGEPVFEAYAEQSTPTAYRIFWYYGPGKATVTVFFISPHP